MNNENGTISLTRTGERTATMIYERHRFFKQQLIDSGVDPKAAEVDACRMEHGISAESFEKLKQSMERQDKKVH